ncbi:Calmodulin-like protein 5 [Striga hermonthica]|uniref:Calmodulin-like protein 5 n=1 Tax=Striga hermonthica TaxID=68872 RepID=A0A9N7MXB2_STRHE|nr:Calmodulin-like protein 5 [Striga hermonthica]
MTGENQIPIKIKSKPTIRVPRRWARRNTIETSPCSMNCDYNISREELSDLLENLEVCVPKQKLRSMIGKIDTDGDAQVDAEEFGALYAVVMADERCDKGENGEEDVREAFRTFVWDGASSSRRMS